MRAVPSDAAPWRGSREGRGRVALSIGSVVALLASYFTGWWHIAYVPPPYDAPFVPVTAIFTPKQGFSLNAMLLLVGLPLLSALFALLTLRGSREARRLFANFGLMAGFFCLEVSIAGAFGVVFIWGWSEVSRVTDPGGFVGFLASLLIFGVAISLSVALPGTASLSHAGVADGATRQ